MGDELVIMSHRVFDEFREVKRIWWLPVLIYQNYYERYCPNYHERVKVTERWGPKLKWKCNWSELTGGRPGPWERRASVTDDAQSLTRHHVAHTTGKGASHGWLKWKLFKWLPWQSWNSSLKVLHHNVLCEALRRLSFGHPPILDLSKIKNLSPSNSIAHSG